MVWKVQKPKVPDVKKKVEKLFALFPVQIGDEWVWLQWYYNEIEWRYDGWTCRNGWYNTGHKFRK